MYGIFKIILQFLILALKHQDQQHSNLHFFFFVGELFLPEQAVVFTD